MGLLDSIKSVFGGDDEEKKAAEQKAAAEKAAKEAAAAKAAAEKAAAEAAAKKPTDPQVNVAPNMTVYFQHGAINGEIKILSAAPGNVAFECNGQSFVLSDAGESYFMINGKAAKFAEASADPANIAFALSAGTTTLITPTQVKSLLGSNNVWADTGDITDAEYFSKEV
jgi:hypothetical protein